MNIFSILDNPSHLCTRTLGLTHICTILERKLQARVTMYTDSVVHAYYMHYYGGTYYSEKGRQNVIMLLFLNFAQVFST